MAPRRHSRTPVLLTRDEQKLMVEAADRDPRIRQAIEDLFGVSWNNLSAQKKLQLIHDFQEYGRAAGAMAGAVRGVRDFERETKLYRDELAAEDKVRLLEEEVQRLRDEIQAQTPTAVTPRRNRSKAATV